MSEHEHLAIVLSVSRLKIDVIMSKKMILMIDGDAVDNPLKAALQK